MRMADSRAQPMGAKICPGLGWQGSKPVAMISVGAPQGKLHEGGSPQLSFSAMGVSQEKSCKNGLAKVPGTKKGAPAMDGPRPLISTVIGIQSMMNPPIMTLSPVPTRPRVERLIN